MNNLKKCALHTAVLMACVTGSQMANAGATISFGEDKYISAGFGFIGGYSSVEDAAANGKDRSNDFSLNNARIYLSGSFNKYIKGMLNTEKNIAGIGGGNSDTIQVMDANVSFQVTPDILIRAGRFLSPSDRSNMAGPFYSSGGGYWNGIASRYGFNGGVIGRDDGVGLEGSLADGVVKYSFGAFEGDNIFRLSDVGARSESAGTKDHLMYAGRVHVNFWDIEGDNYGSSGSYFGAKNVLSVGLSGRVKKDGVVSTVANTVGDYKSYSLDFLLEKKDVGPGTVSLDAAYYYYDTDNVFLGEQGTAYYASLGYLFQEPIGWGKIMPLIRYQKFDADGRTSSASVNTRGNGEIKKFDIGANYIIEPYNALITATYGRTEKEISPKDVNEFKVSLQMQF